MLINISRILIFKNNLSPSPLKPKNLKPCVKFPRNINFACEKNKFCIIQSLEGSYKGKKSTTELIFSTSNLGKMVHQFFPRIVISDFWKISAALSYRGESSICSTNPQGRKLVIRPSSYIILVTHKTIINSLFLDTPAFLEVVLNRFRD